MHCSQFLRGCVIVAICSASLAAVSGLPLIDAVKNNDVTAVRRLLKQHAEVNAQEGDGSTALAWAAYRDNLPIADLLLRAGANAGLANEEGATPLIWRA